MLQLPIIGLFLRTIPEGILGMYAVYVFSGKKFDWKRIFISGVIFGVTIYIIRLLPISFGVHTVLGLVVYILLATQVNKINIISSITSCIIFTIFLFTSEAVTIPLVSKILGIPLDEILSNSTKLIILSTPSLLLVFIATNIVNFIKLKYKKIKHGRH